MVIFNSYVKLPGRVPWNELIRELETPPHWSRSLRPAASIAAAIGANQGAFAVLLTCHGYGYGNTKNPGQLPWISWEYHGNIHSYHGKGVGFRPIPISIDDRERKSTNYIQKTICFTVEEKKVRVSFRPRLAKMDLHRIELMAKDAKAPL